MSGANNLTGQGLQASVVQLKVSQRCGLLSVVFGCSVLFGGWGLGITALRSPIPSFVAMKPNAAALLILSGCALSNLGKRSRFSRLLWVLCSCITVAVGLATLIEYAWGLDLGIDELLVRDLASPGLPYPGRIAVNTAVLVILTGCSLLLVASRRFVLLAQLLAVAAGMLCLVALVGFVFGIQDFFNIGTHIAMAVHTAAGFGILCAGILLVPGHGDRLFVLNGEGAGDIVARRLLPAAFLVPTILGWATRQAQHYGLLDQVDAFASFSAFNILVFASLVWLSARFLNNIDRDRRAAENKFREGEERYRTLFEGMHEGFVLTELIHDAEGKLCDYRLLEVNPVMTRMWGRTREEITGRTYRELFPNKSWEPWVRNFGEAATLQGEIRRLDRYDAETGRYYETYAFSPNSGQVAAIVNDVTDRRQAEQDLRESETQFRTLANAIPQLCWMAHADGWIFWYNQRWYEYTGTTPEQMAGWGWQSVHDPKVLPQVLERWNASIDSGEPFDMVYPLRGADGLFRSFLTRVMPIRDQDGKVVRWFGTNTDISEQRQIQDALRESEERFRNVFENAATGIAIRGLNGKFLSCNPAFCKLVGYTEEELRQIEFTLLIHPDDRASTQSSSSLIEKAPYSFQKEARLVRSDGQVIWVQRFISTFFAAGEDPAHIMVLATDITDRKLAEQQVQQLNAELENRVAERTAQLEAANKELEAFAYSTSHDLRAPLRGIDGWSLALLEDYGETLDATAQSYLQRVRSETQRMGLLIDDLLTLSQVTRSEMQRTSLDLSALAGAVASRLLALETGRQVAIDIQPGLNVSGDGRLLDVVLVNLFSNALKFTSHESQAQIEFGIRDGDEAVFYVRDNGVGFDMAHSQILFGPFQRLHKNSEFPGTGIGLATVQRIIHRHGGRVWAEAIPEHGATFYFTLQPPERERVAA